MSRAKIEVIDTGNIGIYMLTSVVIVRTCEDDDWEGKQIEKEDEEIRDLIKCHPMPSPDIAEGEKFWRKVFDRMTKAEGVNVMLTCSFVRLDIMKKMYQNLTDKQSSLIVERNSTVMENSTL